MREAGSTVISRRRFTLLLATAPFVGAVRTQPVERILRRLVDDGVVPGIAYSIGNEHGTIASDGFGLRSIRPALRMNASTRCPLAAVSKQFAAAAVYLLEQAGVLSLQARLSTYLPDYAHAREMTLAQVLAMRAGIPSSDAAGETPIDGKADDATLIRNLNRSALDFPPGRRFAYSNCAYDVLGLVVERASGLRYAEFIQRHFFAPLHMVSSYALRTRNPANFADGYKASGTGWQEEPATVADAAFASGNLVSTAGDMQLWNRSLLDATILSRASLRAMFAIPALWQGGSLEGYGTVNLVVPSTRHAITLLSNAPPSDRWKPEETARAIYNASGLPKKSVR